MSAPRVGSLSCVGQSGLTEHMCASLSSTFSQKKSRSHCKLLIGAHYWPLTLPGSERLTLISVLSSSGPLSTVHHLPKPRSSLRDMSNRKCRGISGGITRSGQGKWLDCVRWTALAVGGDLNRIGISWHVKHRWLGRIWCLFSYSSLQDRWNMSNLGFPGIMQ